jgi:phosphoribosylformylglycinamidine synthase
LDLDRERAVQAACLAAIRADLVRSAHDCADGGLAVALAECCATGPGSPLGARVTTGSDLRPDAQLFAESASRIVLSVRRGDVARVEQIAVEHGVPCRRLGEVGGDALALSGKGCVVSLPVDTIRETWRTGLSRLLG